MNHEGISGMKAILALLYSKGPSNHLCEEVVGRTKLEKLLFLLEKEALLTWDYEFEAYDYGPCSDKTYDDIGVLKVYDLTDVKRWVNNGVMVALDFQRHYEREGQASIGTSPSTLRLNNRTWYLRNGRSASVVCTIPLESCG